MELIFTLFGFFFFWTPALFVSSALWKKEKGVKKMFKSISDNKDRA